MGHHLYRVTAFTIAGPFSLDVRFDDGIDRRIDFRPVLYGELHGPLRDATVFNKVALDPEVHTLVWPNGADFDPATLHDWPEAGPQMAEMARRWADREPRDEHRKVTRCAASTTFAGRRQLFLPAKG